MSEIIYSTEKKFNGPWLIDKDALVHLDEVIEGQLKLLESYRSDLIENELEKYTKTFDETVDTQNIERRSQYIQENRQYLENRFPPATNEINLEFGDEKKLTSKLIKKELRNPAIKNEQCTKLQIIMKAADIAASVELDKDNGILKIKVSPQKEPLSKEIYSNLLEWADKYKPRNWQVIWEKINGPHWFFYMVALFSSIQIFGSDTTIAMKQLVTESHSLLAGGIDESETKKAIELILSIESKYIPKDLKTSFPLWLKIAASAGLLFSIALSLIPKAVIGIGKGQEQIEKWRLWFKVISLIPAIIASGLILPYLYDLLIK